jgi:beta-aspartyl-peptidase (threonine type)
MLEAKLMRKISALFLGIIGILIIGLAAASRIPAQNIDPNIAPREADRAKIAAVLTAQQTAWNRGDVDAFIVGYWESRELTFSGSSGIARGFDGVRQRYKKNYPDRAAMGQLAFSDLEFRFLGPDAALVLGKWHLKRDNGDLGGVFSLVWQRFPDGWKIIHDHTSTVDAN